MADKNITGLTAASTLDGTELALVTQGGNSRKVTATKMNSEVVHSATSKVTPADNDEVGLVDSAASNVLKRLLWSNVKATLKTYFDTLYAALGGAVFTGAIQVTTIEVGDASDTTVARDAAGSITVEGNKVLSTKAAQISAITGKTTPVDADVLLIEDSAASNAKKSLTWANTKATLKTYFDTLYAASAGTFTAASTTEVLTGTDTTKGVTPDALAALWEKGSDVASSGTISLGEGGYFHVTGTTTITDIDWATAKDGRAALVIFDGILTLTHNATTLKLPGGANITTAAGDRAIFVQDASDNVICVAYIKASGLPVIIPTTGTPFEMHVACSDESTALTTGTAKVTFRMPCAVTLTAVRASLTTAQTSGSIFTVDINEAGTTIISTKMTIDNTELTTATAATPAVISDAALADDALMTVDIDSLGDGTAKGLKITLIGTRA